MAFILPPNEDTIVAVATPPGNSLRGIIRLSGASALSILEKLLPEDSDISLDHVPPYHVFRTIITLSEVALKLPTTIYVMKHPYSYTREDVVEIHTIGSAPLLSIIIEEILTHGVRLAEPGEFTRRAFLNGRIDLAQAEAVLKIINARPAQCLNLRFRTSVLSIALTRTFCKSSFVNTS